MPKWKIYTGSVEQIEEMRNAPAGWIVRYVDTDDLCLAQSRICFSEPKDTEVIKEYLICEPHPFSELIDIWRLSMCPVYERYNGSAENINKEFHDLALKIRLAHPEGIVTDRPNWNSPFYEFSLTPFQS